jgi:hypothetical protein
LSGNSSLRSQHFGAKSIKRRRKKSLNTVTHNLRICGVLTADSPKSRLFRGFGGRFVWETH